MPGFIGRQRINCPKSIKLCITYKYTTPKIPFQRKKFISEKPKNNKNFTSTLQSIKFSLVPALTISNR